MFFQVSPLGLGRGWIKNHRPIISRSLKNQDGGTLLTKKMDLG